MIQPWTFSLVLLTVMAVEHMATSQTLTRHKILSTVLNKEGLQLGHTSQGHTRGGTTRDMTTSNQPQLKTLPSSRGLGVTKGAMAEARVAPEEVEGIITAVEVTVSENPEGMEIVVVVVVVVAVMAGIPDTRVTEGEYTLSCFDPVSSLFFFPSALFSVKLLVFRSKQSWQPGFTIRISISRDSGYLSIASTQPIYW